MSDWTLAMPDVFHSKQEGDRPRILILGGSPFQVPIIRYAKAQGAYVITCDYLPKNPGHALADEYYDVSTTDQVAVLELARALDIDAVLSFASEPALQTVSFVAEALGLPAPSLDAVVQLTDKGAFRRLLRQSGLPAPESVVVTAVTSVSDVRRLMEERGVGIPCIVKPVDSSGSKGITVLDATLEMLNEALAHALLFSRSGYSIIEQYIEGGQIHGDGYLEDGRLVFQYLGDHLFFTDAGCHAPISTRWPSHYGVDVVQRVVQQVETIAKASGYRQGALNIEARITAGGDIYIIELAPRNGGNHIPIIIQHLTGFDFVRRAYLDGIGTEAEPVEWHNRALSGAVYILHSPIPGILEGVALSEVIRPHVILLDLFKPTGASIESFRGSHTSVGVVLLSFSSVDERDAMMAAAGTHMSLCVHSP